VNSISQQEITGWTAYRLARIYLGEFPGVPKTPKILACSRNKHRSPLGDHETTDCLVFGAQIHVN